MANRPDVGPRNVTRGPASVYVDDWLVASGEMPPVAVGEPAVFGLEWVLLRYPIGGGRNVVAPEVVATCDRYALVNAGVPALVKLAEGSPEDSGWRLTQTVSGVGGLVVSASLFPPTELPPECQSWMPTLLRQWLISDIQAFRPGVPDLSPQSVSRINATNHVEGINYRLLCRDLGPA